jgi:hypothetical protein
MNTEVLPLDGLNISRETWRSRLMRHTSVDKIVLGLFLLAGSEGLVVSSEYITRTIGNFVMASSLLVVGSAALEDIKETSGDWELIMDYDLEVQAAGDKIGVQQDGHTTESIRL